MVDPIRKLPSELITHAFHFISTPQLALSNDISQDWRSTLLADPSLNRVIDLTQLKRPLEGMDQVKVVHHLALLSSRHDNEIHVDLSILWEEFAGTLSSSVYGNMPRPIFLRAALPTYTSLITSIALGTNGKLQKLAMQVPRGCYSSRTSEFIRFREVILLGGFALYDVMEHLGELAFDFSFPISGRRERKWFKEIHYRENLLGVFSVRTFWLHPSPKRHFWIHRNRTPAIVSPLQVFHRCGVSTSDRRGASEAATGLYRSIQ